MIDSKHRASKAVAAVVIGLAAAVGPDAAITARAAAGEEVAAPIRNMGVVRIEQVFENYEYRQEREKLIEQELQPRLNEIQQVQAKIRELEEAVRQLLTQVGEDHPNVQQKRFEHQKLMLDLQSLVRAGEERRRELLVKMLADVYKYFNAACRSIGRQYQFGIIVTCLDENIPQMVLDNVQTTPYSIMSQIMMRNVQYIHPHLDLTQYIVTDLNNHYRAYKEGAARGQQLPIYPIPLS